MIISNFIKDWSSKVIIHFFPFEKFTENYIDFIDKKFDIKDHIFILYGSYNIDKSFINKYQNIIVFDKKHFFLYYKLLIKCNATIIHSFSIIKEIQLLLLMNRSFLKKTAWVVWGSDLISFSKINEMGIRNKASYFFKRIMIFKLKSVVFLVEDDWLNFKKTFNIDKKHFTAIYGNGRVFNILKSIDNFEKPPKKHINILVGNSATQSNNHIEALEYLKNFVNKNILIYLPLSYGEESYKNEIISYCNEHFPNTAIMILDFLEYRDYLQLISTMDIAIFNNDRQQALGNIRAAIYFGSKIYFKSGNELANYFDGKIDYDFVHNIKDYTFDEFIYMPEESVMRNKEYIITELDGQRAAEQWSNIFTYLKEG